MLKGLIVRRVRLDETPEIKPSARVALVCNCACTSSKVPDPRPRGTPKSIVRLLV